jgi:uncharacterized protein (DUF924 family)
VDTQILDDIYAYWFGPLSGPEDFPKEKSEIWFKRSDDTDAHIRETFGSLIPEAARREWTLADLTREQQIALVILFDQFPRNIFRTSGEAFAYDAKARDIARALLKLGPAHFYFVERSFLYLPFEHSEDIADQDFSVQLFAEAAVAVPSALKDHFRMFLDYATKHRDLIRKFGRFPHRNEMLGRETTPEEATFIEEQGRGF